MHLQCAAPLQRRVTCNVDQVAGLVRAIRTVVTEANENAGTGLVIGGAVLAALSPQPARSTQSKVHSAHGTTSLPGGVPLTCQPSDPKDALQRSGGHQLHWDRDARAHAAGWFASHRSRQGLLQRCQRLGRLHTQSEVAHAKLPAFVPTLLRSSA